MGSQSKGFINYDKLQNLSAALQDYAVSETNFQSCGFEAVHARLTELKSHVDNYTSKGRRQIEVEHFFAADVEGASAAIRGGLSSSGFAELDGNIQDDIRQLSAPILRSFQGLFELQREMQR